MLWTFVSFFTTSKLGVTYPTTNSVARAKTHYQFYLTSPLSFKSEIAFNTAQRMKELADGP
jgi:hypothetical protein